MTIHGRLPPADGDHPILLQVANTPMPQIHPGGWRELLEHGAGSQLSQVRRRELETLARLAAQLDDRAVIYHGVHWTRLDDDQAIFDDIDFVVVGPSGKVLLIEQVTGLLDERSGQLLRRRGGREMAVAARLSENRAAFEGRLRRALGSAALPPVDILFHCPDYTTREGGSAGLPPERIVDATRRDDLAAIINDLVAADPGTPPVSVESRDRLHRFMTDLLDLVPDASAIVGQASALTTRLSGGLTEWARRLDFSPFRLRVLGTAGSGKTQLAIAVYRDALAAGRRPLYVCYNRPLADHVADILRGSALPAEGMALTFHQLADRIARSTGEIPDFTRADAFERLEAAIEGFEPDDRWRFDVLIVDEGQDFQPRWADALMRLLPTNGRAWWLEDPMQNLYGREPVRPAGWVELRADTNYRSPQTIASLLSRLAGGAPVRSGCPIGGSEVEWLAYDDEPGLIEQTKRAIGLGVAAGFRRDMIALVTCRGRESSRLAGLERLGPYALRSYTGRYDLLGSPIRRDGDIEFDTVMRFKGRSAPCVVLTEADFPDAGETARRRLFVGASRATLRLIVVASRRTRSAFGLDVADQDR